MKKVLALITALLPLLACALTVEVGTVHGQPVVVEMKKNSNKPKCVCIPLQTEDGREAQLEIKMGDVSKMRNLMFEARMKFIEWEKTAEENNVGDFSKDLPVKFFWTDASWIYGNYHSGKIKPSICFYKKSGVCFAVMTAHVQASTNRFITAFLTYTFAGADDFTEWVDVLAHDNIQQKLSESTNYDLEKKDNNVNYNELFH